MDFSSGIRLHEGVYSIPLALNRNVFWICLILTQAALWMGQRAESLYFLLPFAIFCCSAIQLGIRRESFQVPWRQITCLYCVLMALAWTCLAVVEYFGFGFNNYDTGIYAQGVANFVLSGNYRSSILQMPALGEHFTPILLLFTPLLQIKASVLWFPLVKIIAFLCCVPLLYLLSKEVLGKESSLTYVLPLLWVVHSLVARSMYMEFQPSALAQPLIFYCFLCAARGATFRLIVSLAALLLFKEHLAFIWLSVGAFVAVTRREYRLAAGLVFLGLALGSFIYLVAMPWFAAGLPNTHLGRFGPLSLLPAKGRMLLLGLRSLVFLPLLSPLSLFYVLPAFGIALVSNDPQMVTYDFHYQDIALPVLFVASLYGLRDLDGGRVFLRPVSAKLTHALKFAALPLLLFMHSKYPTREVLKEFPSGEHLKLHQNVVATAETVSPSSNLLYQDTFGPLVFFRTNLRSVLKCADALKASPGDVVGLSPLVNPWPMNKGELIGCMGQLRKEVEAGNFLLLQDDSTFLAVRRR